MLRNPMRARSMMKRVQEMKLLQEKMRWIIYTALVGS
jgi:hypothetical protein